MTRRGMVSRSLIVAVAAVAAACSSDDVSDDAGSTAPPAVESTPDTAPPTTAAPATDPNDDAAGFDAASFTAVLAADELDGRDNLTPESAAAQELIVAELGRFAEPFDPGEVGVAAWSQPFPEGVNLVGVQPGIGALADEYVIVGAHYDHLGAGQCDPRDDATDVICNGAADNAAGVAAAIAVADRVGRDDDTDRRTLVVALWDAEEDGLLGAAHYAMNPLFPLAQTVAYVNFDIQGANLLPSLANTSIVIGAETGGPALVDAVGAAVDAASIDYVNFSLLFGQGRSDHAPFAAVGVPVVFFTDANNGCYHTAKDDIDHVDLGKLDNQIEPPTALVEELLTTPTPPSFDPDTPLTTFSDAEQLLDLVRRAEPDFDLLDPEVRQRTEAYLVELEAIVGAGPDAFTNDQAGLVLGGAAALVGDLAATECGLS